MTFEIGTLDSTRWTSNSPTPFGPAPGAGLGEGVQRRPRRAATTDYESGFAADPVNKMTELTVPEEFVQGKDKSYVAKSEPVLQGQVPAALVQVAFTDRGTATKDVLDKGIFDVVKRAGFKMSRSSAFKPVSEAVTWKRKAIPGSDMFQAVVVSPAKLAGMVYAGSLFDHGPISSQSQMSQLPSTLYSYAFAVTTDKATFTDADGAKLLTVLKQAFGKTQGATNSYGYKYVTLKGAAPDVFIGPPDPTPEPTPEPTPTPGPSPLVVAGISSILLIAAYNMLSPHIGSEREAQFHRARRIG